MADGSGAANAHRYREAMRSKAERLGGGEDAKNVDSSSFTPEPKLYGGVKTGMRPISRQARASGGAVSGAHAAATPGRAPRKSGGGLGVSYANRDQKAANAEREGEYPNGGMKTGGRAHRAEGGELHPDVTFRQNHMTGPKGAYALWNKAGDGITSYHDTREEAENAARARESGARSGGRTHRAEGGYLPRQEAKGGNTVRGMKNSTGSSAVETDGRPAAEDGRQGRASGGRVGRQAGGPLATPLSAGMGGQGRMNFNYGPQASEATKIGLKDGGRAKAHERYGHGPSCSCPDCKGKAAGGRVGRATGGAAPGPGENIGAVGQPSFHHRAPKGENSSRARTLASAEARADGGKVATAALKAHHVEHEAMAKGRARGGKAGKGKTNINIIIGHPGGASAGAPPPIGANPALAIRPPPAAAPMPMPAPGGAPAPGAPTPMPIPVPMGGAPGAGMPPGMPPRARGGRAPKVRGEPEAGSGSGLGRLQKAKAYGHRSREGEGLRK
jgi:hypothetical protein